MVVYFSLGTNLGDKEQNLRMAVQKIRKQIGEVISLSAFYATAPWGFSSDNTFLNAALCVDTALAPLEVLQTRRKSSGRWGRTHKSVNAVYSDRVIDIDLLLCFADDGTPVFAGYSRTETSSSADAGTPFRDGAVGGDCFRRGAPGIGKDNRGIVAKSVLISAICSADTRFLFYLCPRKAKIGCTSA